LCNLQPEAKKTRKLTKYDKPRDSVCFMNH
jgi:hypothetical protein